MDKVNLGLWNEEGSLTEIFQSVDIKFALVNNKYEQVHQPCKCRDFLGDLMFSRKWGIEVSIYGMKYDYAKSPYDTEVTRISLKFPDKNAKTNFINNFTYLTSREQVYNIPVSVLLETDQENTLIVEGDKNWQEAVWKLSLYTFYMKVMSYKDTSKLNKPEDKYKESLTDDLEAKFLSNILKTTDYIDRALSTNHNAAGFVTCIHVRTNYDTHYKAASPMAAKKVAETVLGAIA